MIIMTIYDIEYVALIVLLVVLFVVSLQKKSITIKSDKLSYCLSTSKDAGVILKAYACIMVLMSHFVALRLNNNLHIGVSKFVYLVFANVALTIFMFISGYGMTMKALERHAIKDAYKRLKKIYLPSIFVSFSSLVFYIFIPNVYSLEDLTYYHLPKDIWVMHNLSLSDIPHFAIYVFGAQDWYVRCIIYFYIIFYISYSVSKKLKFDISICMGVLFLLYIIVAYYAYGMEKAEFFRYPCAFLTGHLIAKYIKKENVKTDIYLYVISLFTILFHGIEWLAYYLIALLFISLVNRITQCYHFKKGLLFNIGIVSYFFYLCHIRIGYPMIIFSRLEYVIVWIIVTYLISVILYYSYNRTLQRLAV